MALSGDIELNLGPGSSARSNTLKCSLCKKGVGTTRKCLQCSQCRILTHITCSNIPKKKQKHYTAQTIYAWLCNDCTLSILPFYHSRDLDMFLSDGSDDNVSLSQNDHHQKLNEHSKHTSIVHLNIQAIMSTFNEFVMTLQEYQFDIVALSETWLQHCLFQQNYVQLNGYNSFFRNRIDKRGGGVGFYIKDSITYKVRHDLWKIHNNLQIVFTEIRGRNKNTPSIICVAYQTSSNETERPEWLDNFESLSADVYLKWKGVFIVTGDFNIDLLGEPKESTLRYKNLLHTVSLHQHITKATRKNKTLINHISSNMDNKLLHTDVLMTDEISDHETPYGIFNIKKKRYKPRYKYVRNEKDLNINDYVSYFKLFPTSIVFGFDDPNDQIAMLNKLVTDCIADLVPLKKIQIYMSISFMDERSRASYSKKTSWAFTKSEER